MLATTAFYESGRRDLNSTAPMRGRCFIGTYAHQRTALARIGRYGTANITANTFNDYDDLGGGHGQVFRIHVRWT